MIFSKAFIVTYTLYRNDFQLLEYSQIIPALDRISFETTVL